MSDPPLTNVSRAVRYREIAENCRTWAKEARNEAERKDFLDMARIGARANAEFDKGPTEGGLIRSSPVVSASGATYAGIVSRPSCEAGAPEEDWW